MNNSIFFLTESFHKIFETDSVSLLPRLSSSKSMFKGDTLSFMAAYVSDIPLRVKVESALQPYLSVRRIDNVPVKIPAFSTTVDTDYLNGKRAGNYPDVLIPLAEDEELSPTGGKTMGLYFEILTPTDMAEGEYPVTVTSYGENFSVTQTLTVTVLDAVLPSPTLIYANWFHYDCLASYYCVDIFSKRHFEIIESFMRMARKTGVNMIYMPVFTPALDTEIGGERPTVQLVSVTKNADGTYAFDYALCDFFLALCDKCGFTHYEISHLFTQWGAYHAPKIMAKVNGEYTRIFGWETDSLSEEYIGFLKAFLASFKAYMKRQNRLDNCMFHISDEPNETHLAQYTAIYEALKNELGDVYCGDALSLYDYYEKGIVKNPIASTDHIAPFIAHNVPNLWAYYCCSEQEKVSNRFMAMSPCRTRIIGTQFFKFDIKGFLQWGFNFYYSQYSKHMIDPYTCNDGCIWVPAGDAFMVYPAPDGTPYESLHIVSFTEALYDLRAFALLSSLIGKDEAVKFIEDEAKTVITFDDYPKNEDFCEALRQKVNAKIAKFLDKRK